MTNRTPSGTPQPSATPGRRWPAMFVALRYRNYRLWFFGQTVSMMGTWMQSVAQSWLVYELTGSKLALGVVSFMGSLPTLFFMLPAGAVVDRLSKRSLLLATQITMMSSAFVLAGLAGTGVLQVWHIAFLAVVSGVAASFDAPARQALAVEMVEDRSDLTNAIALNSTIFNLARVVGPAIGGIVLAQLGATWCFGLNGLSFLAVILALLQMRLPDRRQMVAAGRLAAQVAAGLGYVRGHVLVRSIMVLVGVSSLFGASYGVLMPVFAADVLRVGETGLGTLNAAVGAGALAGSLFVASLGHFRHKGLVLSAGSVLFPTAVIVFSFSRFFPLSLATLSIVGFAFVAQNALCNTIIQQAVPDALRGRVMSVYMLMFFGTSPFASLQAGTLAQALGPTAGVAVGGAITLLSALVLFVTVPALRRSQG